jgi:hypothetical protein
MHLPTTAGSIFPPQSGITTLKIVYYSYLLSIYDTFS